MRAILEDMRTGEVAVHEVPVPELQPGGILVRTAFSAISAGTEKVKIEQGKMSLLGKAMARPDLVRQVIDYARDHGLKAAYQKVQAKLDTLSTMGYSCSGTVLEAGASVTEFAPGDRVACAGMGYATHADINLVPRNLAVRVPEGVSLEAAALTTIGAIAMQGVRQARLSVGESVAVIGAGLVGVLTAQIARAAGCRVVALDVSPERAKKAVEFGAHLGAIAGDPALLPKIREFSRYGLDAAIVTAATPSAEPVELASKLLRDRGRIVVVGDVGLGVSRRDMYLKELSMVLSRSYGPGRYDPEYEEGGKDYPIGYVRWTERRNMEAFLDLLATGAITVPPLLEKRYRLEEAANAFAELKSGMYTALIDYGAAEPIRPAVAPPPTRAPMAGEVRVACVGAGGFARGVIFPALKTMKGVTLEAVGSASGATAESARAAFAFQRAQSPAELLQNPDVSAAFIITRHDSHAAYVIKALENHKAVFVEKPLAVSREELEAIRAAHSAQSQSGRSPFLMVGFNRRFAPLTAKVTEFFSARTEPMMVHARINAGFIPRDHWIQREDGGGRIAGELCHFVDWARAVIARPIQSVRAVALPDGSRYSRDNLAVMLTFADGSLANIVYVANGDRAVHKEQFEVFCQGGVARLDDFRVLELSRNGRTQKVSGRQDKGHLRELQLTIEAIRDGAPAPITFVELVEVTQATLAAEEAVRTGHTITLERAAAAGA